MSNPSRAVPVDAAPSTANAAIAAAGLRTIIRPPVRWPGLGLTELWRFRALAVVLAQRSLMVRYRQTVVGVAWVLIQPLTLMLVFTVFFGILVNVSTRGVPYPVFVYVGLMLWIVVSRVLSEGSTSVVSHAGLLSKIYFPRAYFPIAVAIGSLVDFAFGMAALVALLLFYGITPNLGVLLIPVMTLIAVAAVLGVTFWLSALNARYRDVALLLPFLTQLWFFLTPIIYASAIVPPEWRLVYWLNPLAVTVDGFRWACTGSEAPPMEAWLLACAISAVLLVSGYMFFRSREPWFSDEL